MAFTSDTLLVGAADLTPDGNSSNTQGGVIRAIPLAGGPATTAVTLGAPPAILYPPQENAYVPGFATDGATPTAFVFDGTDFFEMDSFAADGSTRPRITKIPGNGGAKVTVVTLEDWGSAIAVDADCVYWANGGGVFSVAKTATATGG